MNASIGKCFSHVLLGGDPGEDPGHVSDYVTQLAWERLGIHPGSAGECLRGAGSLDVPA